MSVLVRRALFSYVRLVVMCIAMAGCASLPTQSQPPADGGEDVPAATYSEDDFFADLPKGYDYVSPDPEIEETVRERLAASGGQRIIEDLFMRDVEYGSVPAATVMVVAFNEQATSADLQGFVRGIEQDAGVKARAVDLQGISALYLDANPPVFVYSGESYVISVVGQNEARLRTITAAIASSAP